MRGEYITLRAVLKEDNEAYYKWINDKSLVLNNANYKPISEFEHERWFNNINLNKESVIFSIIENSSQQLIGSCSLRNINHIHRNAELQIRIGEYDFQGKGFGTEAINLLVAHGFNDINLIRIYLHVFCNNNRAIKAYEKCNFHTEGLLRKAAYINGEYLDVMLMSIINDSI